MKKSPKIYFFILALFPLFTSKVWAGCGDCTAIYGEFVKLKEVGVVVGDYHYIITKDNRKVQIQDDGVKKAEIALALNLPLYINTENNNYSIKSE